jgi:hypothetical protein
MRESALLVWEDLYRQTQKDLYRQTQKIPHKQEGISDVNVSPSSRRSGGVSSARKRRSAKIASEERSLRRRLERAVGPNAGGAVLGQANIAYELTERTRAVSHEGMGMVAKLVAALGMADEIYASLHLLKSHRPYHESDHVLNVAYNACVTLLRQQRTVAVICASFMCQSASRRIGLWLPSSGRILRNEPARRPSQPLPTPTRRQSCRLVALVR